MAACDEAQTLDKIMQLLEREPSSTLSNGRLFQLAATDIPALREQANQNKPLTCPWHTSSWSTLLTKRLKSTTKHLVSSPKPQPSQTSLGPEAQSQVTSKTLAHPAQQIKPLWETQFANFYQPVSLRNLERFLFSFALGYASFRFLWIWSYPLLRDRDTKLANVYYTPQGYWKGIAAIKKLAESTQVPEETANQWLIKQILWQIYFPAPRYILRPKFDVSVSNAVHQAWGRKIYKYALTFVDVASR